MTVRKRSEVLAQKLTAAERTFGTESAVEANARSGGLKVVRAQNGMRTGTYCAVCRAPQFMGVSGVICDQKHVEVGAIDATGMRVHVERDETPVHPVHAEQYGHKMTATSSKTPRGGISTPVGHSGAPEDAGSDPTVAGIPESRAPIPGQSVIVSRGEWLVQPVQYNSFRVGAVTVETPVYEGETYAQAVARAHEVVRFAQLKNAEKDLLDYLDFLAKVGAEVQKRTR